MGSLISSHDQRLMVAPAPQPASPNGVCVVYTGWLGVTIPQRGAAARKHLIDVISADVIVAGTYLPSDCNPKVADSCAVLWPRLAALGPFAAKSLEPMPTHKMLWQMLERNMPAWSNVTAVFKPENTFWGLNIFSPLLGTQSANCLREMQSYERGFELMQSVEHSRALRYSHVLFSRLEYEWLAPHPPISSFFATEADRHTVWAPPPDVNGMNDRHAVMARRAAAPYFRRLSQMYSTQLLKRFSLSELVSFGPERFLAESLKRGDDFLADERRVRKSFALNPAHPAFLPRQPRFRLGEFLLPAYLACCANNSKVNTCWRTECAEVALVPPERGTSPLVSTSASSTVAGTTASSMVARGKYALEVRDAVTAWRWLQCSGGAYGHGLVTAKDALQPTNRRMLLVVPAADQALNIESELSLNFLLLNRSFGTEVPSLSPFSEVCPLVRTKVLLKPVAAVPGYCVKELTQECKGLHEQHSLRDCAHACMGCATCEALSFSHAKGRCTLHRTACALHHTTELKSPDAKDGWDTLYMRRTSAGQFVGKRSAFLPVARQGHCGPTNEGEEGHCNTGDRGSLRLFDRTFNLTDELSCVRFCTEKCARCKYVSFSARGKDCSWYNECKTLEREPAWLHHKTYATKRAFKHVPKQGSS